VLGSSVLWFERDARGAPLPPAAWRAAAMASVTTHDLPTAAGYLDGEHVRLRTRLGLLARSVDEETAAWRRERAALLGLLCREGLLDSPPAAGWPDRLDPGTLRQAVFALHAALVRSPSRIVLAAPGDAVGDRRQPNMPGTVDSYPNWRLPLTDRDGVPVTIERLVTEPDVRRLADLLATVRTPAQPVVRRADRTGDR
jgi:4-alpha-glucanotransferase